MNIKKIEIGLLEVQVEIILKSLKFYIHTYRYIFPSSNTFKTKEEELQISLLTDTYEQISSQFVSSTFEKPVISNNCNSNPKKIKKIS